MIINTEGQSLTGANPEHKIRLRFFQEGQNEEVLPIVQYGGMTLIRQNIGIQCESQNPQFVSARGEVNELEGYFCVLQYTDSADMKAMPKFVRITVSAFGKNSQDKVLYKDVVTEFDVQLVSEIKVETKFRGGVKLYRDVRKEQIKVFSSSDFKVSFDYGAPEEA